MIDVSTLVSNVWSWVATMPVIAIDDSFVKVCSRMTHQIQRELDHE